MIKKISDVFKNSYTKIVLSGVLMYFAAVFAMPYLGVLRTIPFVAVLGVLCGVLNCSKKITCAFCAAFTFALYAVYGESIAVSLMFAAINSFLVVLSMWGFNSFKTLVTKQYGSRKLKYIVDAVGETLLFVLIFVFAFGNAFTFAKKDDFATKYIDEHYEDNVEKKFTYYDAPSFCYKTTISFNDDEGKFGDENNYYISEKNGVLTDGFRDYCEDKMLVKTNLRLKQLLSMTTPNPLDFEISNSFVDFEKDEVLKLDADGNDYLDRTVFVVSFYSVVQNKGDFYKLVEDYTRILGHDESFTFKEIMFLGGNASDILYTAVVTPETKPKDFISLIHEFDEKEALSYGITEKTYLDYWQNK